MYAQLTPPQAALYESVVNKAKEALQPGAGGTVPHKGRVILKLMSDLKQICNHPRACEGASVLLARRPSLSRTTMPHSVASALVCMHDGSHVLIVGNHRR